MNVFDTIPNLNSSVLTIGMFDGVHAGHQLILNKTVEEARKRGVNSVVLTFSNHPSTLFKPNVPKKKIITIEHRLKLFKELGLDIALVIPFTPEFAKQTGQEFLNFMKVKLGVQMLVLGYDGRLGSDRVIGEELKADIPVLTVSPYIYQGAPLSSSRVRDTIVHQAFSQLVEELNRPYSIYTKQSEGRGVGKKIGYPTLNFYLPDLVLPPLGVYEVSLKGKKGIANLGKAPTFNREGPPLLEVHMLEPGDFDEWMEVIFIRYMREEKKFDTVEALKNQIQKDISSIRS